MKLAEALRRRARAPARSRAPGGRVRRLGRAAGALALTGVVASVGAVAALRWVDPPTTAFMLLRRYEAWRADRAGFDVAYEWVDLGEIAPAAARAVVAAEDQKFAAHHGFDTASIEKALEETRRRRGRGRTRGASTISQQVAKNLFLWPGRSWVRKGAEAWLTLLIEVLWPKERILEVYLNVAELGDGVFGVGAASGRYFDKPAARLAPSEAALLAAVLPNPRRLSVATPSPYVRRRQAWILRQMGAVELPDRAAG